MLGRALEIRDVPFFWSAHHDVTISYVGHAERFDRVVDRRATSTRATRPSATSTERRVRAIATINRDAISLRAEHAFEDEDQATLRLAPRMTMLKRRRSDGASDRPSP